MVKSPFAPHSRRELADADSLEAVRTAMVRICTDKIPCLLWTVAEGRPPPQSVEYSDVHRQDRMGQFVTVVAPYAEQDGSGVQSITELLKTGLWNAKQVPCCRWGAEGGGGTR